MKIILRRCHICLAWYRPQAHNYHCGYCGAIPISHVYHLRYNDTLDKLVPLVRSAHLGEIILRALRLTAQ